MPGTCIPYNIRLFTYISQALFIEERIFYGISYIVRVINPSKGCIIQPFRRLYYTIISLGRKKGVSKGVKRPQTDVTRKEESATSAIIGAGSENCPQPFGLEIQRLSLETYPANRSFKNLIL